MSTGKHGANGHQPATAVLHVGGLHYASEKAVVERSLGAQAGVVAVEANPVAQTATVEYDASATSIEQLKQWVEDCGFHCAGRSVPGHVCDPLAHEGADAPAHDHAAAARADDAHGHGHGGHAGMSMAEMVRDMRNRFLEAVGNKPNQLPGCHRLPRGGTEGVTKASDRRLRPRSDCQSLLD